jgi:hypothetical protein
VRKLIVLITALLLAIAGAGMSDGGAVVDPGDPGTAYPRGTRYCQFNDYEITQAGYRYGYAGTDFACRYSVYNGATNLVWQVTASGHVSTGTRSHAGWHWYAW